MMVFPFERSGDLMTVAARVWGAHEYRELLLVVDTGAAATSIEPAILEGLGYSSRDAILRTRVPSPAGIQHGRLFRVSRFHALGAELSSFVVQALAFNDEHGVDGLLGMNFSRITTSRCVRGTGRSTSSRWSRTRRCPRGRQRGCNAARAPQ